MGVLALEGVWQCFSERTPEISPRMVPSEENIFRDCGLSGSLRKISMNSQLRLWSSSNKYHVIFSGTPMTAKHQFMAKGKFLDSPNKKQSEVFDEARKSRGNYGFQVGSKVVVGATRQWHWRSKSYKNQPACYS